MSVENYLPFWNQLSQQQQTALKKEMLSFTSKSGDMILNFMQDCEGLLLVLEGQLRVYVLSSEGKEVTLYRLLAGDLCIFSASCILNNIEFEVQIEAEQATSSILIPSPIYMTLMKESPAVANFTNSILAKRFSDVMWILEQILFKKFDARLAGLLLEESDLVGSSMINITHEKVARHLGSAREVVTRMLKYFQMEGMVTLKRGGICIEDRKKLLLVTQSRNRL